MPCAAEAMSDFSNVKSDKSELNVENDVAKIANTSMIQYLMENSPILNKFVLDKYIFGMRKTNPTRVFKGFKMVKLTNIDRDVKVLCQRYEPRLFSNSIAWKLMKQSWNWPKFLDMDFVHTLQEHGVQIDSKFFITGRINSARQPDGSELIFPKLKHGGKLIIVPMDISKFPEFPQWVGFFESMDDFADKVRLFWKRNDRIRAKLKKKEARKLQAKAIAEKKVSKKDLEKVIAEISKVIDMQTDPEEFKDQVTSIVRKSKMKSKTSL